MLLEDARHSLYLGRRRLGENRPWQAIVALKHSVVELKIAGLYGLAQELASCQHGCRSEDVTIVLDWFQEWIDLETS